MWIYSDEQMCHWNSRYFYGWLCYHYDIFYRQVVLNYNIIRMVINGHDLYVHLIIIILIIVFSIFII